VKDKDKRCSSDGQQGDADASAVHEGDNSCCAGEERESYGRTQDVRENADNILRYQRAPLWKRKPLGRN